MSHILCAASAYEKKYYFNKKFDILPKKVKDELQILCVLFTEENGGTLSFEYEEDGSLVLNTDHNSDDFFYDEIGAEYKVRKLIKEQQELLQSLELFYRTFCAIKEE